MTKLITVDEVFTKIKTLSKIVRLKEEDNVIRKLIQGTSKKKVLEGLKKNHPRESISMGDLDKFLYEFRYILDDEVTALKSTYGRRLLKQKDGLTNELLELALSAKNLIDKFQDDDDNTNTIGAIRAASDIFMKVGKIQGIFDEKPEVSVNIQMDKVINEVTSQNSDLKNKILKVLEPKQIIVDAEVVDE